MPEYSNGHIPESLLVTFATGWNAAEGTWKHQLSPGTYAKWLALVALAKKNRGRTLEITEGWGAYRPFSIQQQARRMYGTGAAWPGTSSHGGFWEGQQTLAIDVGNWGSVYGWDRGAFYQDVRACGLTPGLISPGRGYPDEPWHVVDLAPWAPAPAPTKTPTAPVVVEEEEEDDMKNCGVYYEDGTNTWKYLIFNTGSGWWHEFGNGNNAGKMPPAYNNAFAKALGTEDWAQVTAGHARVIKQALGAVQRTQVTGSLSVDIDS